MVAGGRLTDWISLGVLASWVPADAVDDAIEATGKQAQRRGGKLPPRSCAKTHSRPTNEPARSSTYSQSDGKRSMTA